MVPVPVPVLVLLNYTMPEALFLCQGPTRFTRARAANAFIRAESRFEEWNATFVFVSRTG